MTDGNGVPTDTMVTAPKNNKQEDKTQFSLIPFDVLGKYLEPAYREGLIKYYRESWRQGFKVSDMYDATTRHLTDFFYKGEDYDPDAAKLGITKHHLGGALFSILCMLQSLETRGEEIDDRPHMLQRQLDIQQRGGNGKE